jgi:hypothetical protein
VKSWWADPKARTLAAPEVEIARQEDAGLYGGIGPGGDADRCYEPHHFRRVVTVTDTQPALCSSKTAIIKVQPKVVVEVASDAAMHANLGRSATASVRASLPNSQSVLFACSHGRSQCVRIENRAPGIHRIDTSTVDQ